MALQRTQDRRRAWAVGLSIASAVGVAAAFVEAAYRSSFDDALGLFGALVVVPLIPLIGLRLTPTPVRTKVLLATGIVFFVWVWIFVAAALFEPWAVAGLWHTLALFGFPFAIFVLVLLSMLKAAPTNGKGAI
jgi:hypothetical protein